MGHRNIETTMDIYAEATEEKKQEVYSLKTGYAVAKIVICKDNEVESKKY